MCDSKKLCSECYEVIKEEPVEHGRESYCSFECLDHAIEKMFEYEAAMEYHSQN